MKGNNFKIVVPRGKKAHWVHPSQTILGHYMLVTYELNIHCFIIIGINFLYKYCYQGIIIWYNLFS